MHEMQSGGPRIKQLLPSCAFDGRPYVLVLVLVLILVLVLVVINLARTSSTST